MQQIQPVPAIEPGNPRPGLVHIAPGCGAEDQQLGRVNNLPFVSPLDDSAIFLDGFGPFSGRNANEIADDVIAALKAKGHTIIEPLGQTSANSIAVTDHGLFGAPDPRTRGAEAAGY